MRPRNGSPSTRGQFSGGWDKLREETFARQKKLGVVPADAKLTPRPKEIPAWLDMSAEQRRLFERQMETFAGFAEHTDHEVGRLVAQLEAIGELDDTLFYYIVGDNGASAEGGPEGTYNEMMALNGIVGKADQMMDHIDAWGDATTFPHFAIGWAWAGDTPFQWTKQVASHFGGTRNGMVLHWPKGIKAKGEVRTQFHHVVDVAATALEAAKVPQPKLVNGIAQRPMDGISMLYSVDAPEAADRRTTQYFEMFGNRAIYHEGWVACTRHSIPWLLAANPTPLLDDVWELYNVNEDFSEANDLARQRPEKLKELQAVFMAEAVRNHVLPIDDRRAERFNPVVAGRPDLLGERKSLTVYPGMTGMLENAFINVKGVHHTVTAEVEVKDATAEGVIIAQAGYFGGWTLYMKGRRGAPRVQLLRAGAHQRQSACCARRGKAHDRYEFIPDAQKPGTGGKSILSIDGQKVAEGKIPKTEPFMFSADEGTDVGLDGETNVSPDYPQGNNAFTGRIVKVTVAQK
jgi:arylsulfatase